MVAHLNDSIDGCVEELATLLLLLVVGLPCAIGNAERVLMKRVYL